jgi:hypothetical protein
MTEFSLREQIEEVERELALRARVYPGLVHAGKMRQSIGAYHMARMQAVSETLKRLQAQRERKTEKVTHDRND